LNFFKKKKKIESMFELISWQGTVPI